VSTVRGTPCIAGFPLKPENQLGKPCLRDGRDPSLPLFTDAGSLWPLFLYHPPVHMSNTH